MDAPILEQRRVLIVEDQFLIAEEMAALVRGLGGEVVGPVGRVRAAIALINAHADIDLALLDINLAGEMAFQAAMELRRRSVPFIVATGYDVAILPPELDHAPRLEKPVTAAALLAAVEDLELNRPG